jgi:hypothetical protein
MTQLSCEEAEGLLAFAALSGIDAPEDDALRRHLTKCASCLATAHRNAWLTALLAEHVEPVEPPARLRHRIMATVYEEAAAGRSTSRSWVSRLWDRLPRSRTLTLASVAVAVTLAIALIWRVATPTMTYAVRTAGSATIEVASDHQNGTATLQVRGLPSPPQGGTSVYEVWLLPSHGSPEPAAYLEQQPGGDYAAVVDAGGSSSGSLGVSLEPRRGDPKPEGPIVFTIPLST